MREQGEHFAVHWQGWWLLASKRREQCNFLACMASPSSFVAVDDGLHQCAPLRPRLQGDALPDRESTASLLVLRVRSRAHGCTDCAYLVKY